MRYNSDAIGGADSAYTITTDQHACLAVSKDSNNDVRHYKNGSADANNPINVSEQTNDGDMYCAFGRSGSQWFDGYIDWALAFDAQLSDQTIQDLYNAVFDGYLTTATKTFSTSVQPDLQNLDYDLNGQDITLDVIGSPGTANEEIVSQTLDGSTAYALTWSDSHADFRVKIDLGSTDKTTSPVARRVELTT
jgi:hypothetical protein